MDIPLRVLILEDSPRRRRADGGRAARSGLAPERRRVSTERDYLDGLDPSLDVILGDRPLPGWMRRGPCNGSRSAAWTYPFSSCRA